MWPFPKKNFEWREPKEFRRLSSAREDSMLRWWHRPLAGFLTSCVFMASWGIAKVIPNKHPIPFQEAFAVSLVGGFFLVYFLTWVYRIVPSLILIVDDRIFRIVGNSREEWPFKKLKEFVLFEFKDFALLVLFLRDGRHSLIGIPSEMEWTTLEVYLCGKGLMQRPINSAMRENWHDKMDWPDLESFLSADQSA